MISSPEGGNHWPIVILILAPLGNVCISCMVPFPNVFSPINFARLLSLRAPATISDADALLPFTRTSRGVSGNIALPSTLTVLWSVLIAFFTSLGLLLSPVGLTSDALGRPTLLPWGVIVDAVDLPFANVPVHPLLLYGVVVAIATFLVTWFSRVWARTYVGRLFVISSSMYGFLWLALGVVRWYSPRPFWGLDIFWLNAFLYIVIALGCMVYIIRKHAITQRVKQAQGNL